MSSSSSGGLDLLPSPSTSFSPGSFSQLISQSSLCRTDEDLEVNRNGFRNFIPSAFPVDSHPLITAEFQLLLGRLDFQSLGRHLLFSGCDVVKDSFTDAISLRSTAPITVCARESSPNILDNGQCGVSLFPVDAPGEISRINDTSSDVASTQTRAHLRVNNRLSRSIQKVIQAKNSNWHFNRHVLNHAQHESLSMPSSMSESSSEYVELDGIINPTEQSSKSNFSSTPSNCEFSSRRQKRFGHSYDTFHISDSGGSKRKRSYETQAIVNPEMQSSQIDAFYPSTVNSSSPFNPAACQSCLVPSPIDPSSSLVIPKSLERRHPTALPDSRRTVISQQSRVPITTTSHYVKSIETADSSSSPLVLPLSCRSPRSSLNSTNSSTAPQFIAAGVSSSSPSGGLRPDKNWSEGSGPSSSSSGGGPSGGGSGDSGGEQRGGGGGGGSGDTPPPDSNPPDGHRHPRSPGTPGEQPVVIEFAVKNFWKVAKQQNDIESSEIGHCRGFYYRLLIHPKGTTGTDSEASHLSVFLEAVRQPWFPEDWVFPNVRFELTVINFRDPKQNVTSWAHWSFSNDATSRGWQKMLSHSRLNRLSGFMDDEGTVLIRGKAEPPYAMLWSRVLRYHPHHLWALMPHQPTTNSNSSSGIFSGSPNLHSRESSMLLWRESQSVLQICDQVVPSIKIALHADYVACFVLILYHLREFRREIFLWNTSLNPCNLTGSYSKGDVSTDAAMKSLRAGEHYDTVVGALQSAFAEMQLWPLVATANQLSLEPSTSHAPNKADVPDSIEWLRRQLASGALSCSRNRQQGLQQPGVKSIMKALCLHDVQKMDVVDPLPRIHTELFTMIHRECQIAYVSHVYKQALLDAKKQHNGNQSVDERLDDTCDAQELDHALRVLFSTVACGSPREPLSGGDYAASFLRAKHVHSMYRALEQSGRKLKRFPEVLFVYLTPQRNTKKGELFDVPLRLEISNLLEAENCSTGDTANDDSIGDENKKTEPRNNTSSKDEKVIKREREKQKRRLRKKQARTRTRRVGGDDDHNDDDDDDDDAEDLNNPNSSGRGSLTDELGAGSTHQSSRQDKWYSLYAVVIREGDSAGSGGGSQTIHTLLLRPEEDGPWFRIVHNRVEKLYPKVDFSEWKCHRDFFCTAAVYVAEDYIDAVANGDVDLEGDLRDLNPELYERTLSQLNASEEQVFRRLKAGYELSVAPPPVTASSSDVTPRKSNETFARGERWKEKKEVTKDLDEWSHLKFEPKKQTPTSSTDRIRWNATTESSEVTVERPPMLPFPLSTDTRFLSPGVGFSHPGTLFCSPLFTPTRICDGALTSYRDCVILHHHVYQHRLTECLQLGNRTETKRSIVELIADRLALTGYDNTSIPSNSQRRLFRSLSVTSIPQFPNAPVCCATVVPYPAPPPPSQPSWQTAGEYANVALGDDANPLTVARRRGRDAMSDTPLWKRRASSEDCLSKSRGERLSRNLLSTVKSLDYEIDNLVTLLFEIQQDVNLYCLAHRGKVQSAADKRRSDAVAFEDIGLPENSKIDAFVDGWLKRIWATASNLVVEARKRIGREHKDEIDDYACILSPEQVSRQSLSVLNQTSHSTEIQQRSKAALNRVTHPSTKGFNPEESTLSTWDTSSLLFPRLGVADIMCAAVAAAIEARSAAEWLLLSAGGAELYPSVSNAASPVFASVDSIPPATDSIGQRRPVSAIRPPSRNAVDTTPQRSRETVFSSQGKRRRSESSKRDFGDDRRYDYDAAEGTKAVLTIRGGETARLPAQPKQPEVKPGKKKETPSAVSNIDGSNKSLRRLLNCLNIHQDFACLVDVEDFMPSHEADEFQRASVANFGTAPLLLPYMLSQSGGPDVAALRNLRSLDSMLGSVGSGLQQLVNTPRFIRISISVEPDLVGLEGFACEQEPPVSRILTARSGMSVSTFYGLMRLFIHRTCHQKWENCPPVDPLALLNPTSGKETSADNSKLTTGRKNENTSKSKPKLVTSWKGTSIDSFMLYALVPDPDPTRKGRHRFVYMQPDESMDTYCDTKRKLTDPDAPDVIVLVMPCPVENSTSPRLAATKKTGNRTSTATLRAATASNVTITRFPRQDDSLYPLLIFKWFDHTTLDLMCMGAQVCDSRKRLEDYIVDWLLPMVRQVKLLPSLCGESSRDDVNNYVVVEECHIRSCQNVRRFNAAIKKINKRTGDVIIVQLKKDLTSPTAVIERLGTEVLRKLSQNTFMHAVSSPFGASWNRLSFDGDSGSLREADAVLLAASALATSADSPCSRAVGGDVDKREGTKVISTVENKKSVDVKADSEDVPAQGSAENLTLDAEDDSKVESKRQTKKKKRATVVKTNIPANTKSRIKAQAQEERRREADQQKCLTEEKDEVLESSEPVSVEPESSSAVITPTTVKCPKGKTTKGKGAWRDILNQAEIVAEPLKLKQKGKQKKESEQLNKGSSQDRTSVPKKLTQSSSIEQNTEQTSPNAVEKSKKNEVKKEEGTIDSTIVKKSIESGQLSSSSTTYSGTVDLKMIEKKQEIKQTTGVFLPHSLSSPMLWKKDLPTGRDDKKFPVAAEAVMGTFPDGLALVMRRHLKFDFEFENVVNPACVGGLENLKVFLDPSCKVSTFVFEVIVAALEEIQSVPLRARMVSGSNHQLNQSGSTTSRKATATMTGGDSRVSRTALSVSYHIERLFNDYLRDDRQNQQEIVMEFRKQLDALTTSPVSVIDLQQSTLEPREEDDEMFECESDLFEQALSSRQLAALELFAALFIASDLIGTRKGLHSLTMCLLGDHATYLGTSSTRKIGVGLKSLQSGADANATNSAVQQCSSLCSLCFLFFILGAKQVVKLADSQAGRRYFDTVMKKLSDWLRRLSMVAFSEVDPSLQSASTRRHQLLVRHSYWALVLVLKDIVAGRTPVVATIVARETEAALSLASLPFRAASGPSPEKSSSPKFARSGDRNTALAGTRGIRSALATEGRRKASWAAMVQSFTEQEEKGDKEDEETEEFVARHEDEDEDSETGMFDEEDESEELMDDEDYDEDEDIAIPIRHHHSKQSQRGAWNFNRVAPKQSIISIAAAVAASPGKHLITGSSMLGSPSVWSNKETDSSAVEKAYTLYNRTEDRVTEMRLFLDRRTGRPRVSKDKPRVVHDSRTWFVTYKPAFWHCSGPSHCVDRPLDLHRLKQGDIERTLRNISNIELQHSGKMESFHLWLMKQFPTQETIRRWTELECGLCHRIDLETSGAVLIARTRRARDFLWDQFRRRNVHKEYLLLCHGRIKNRFGVVKTRLLTKDYDSRSRIKSHFTQVVQEGGEDSLTEYHLCRVYRRKKWTDIVKSLLETPPKVGEYVLPPDKKSEGAESDGSSTSTTRSKPKSGKRSRSESPSSPDAESPVIRNHSGTGLSRGRMWIDPGLNGKLTEDDEFSLCKCRIVTGRTHQIRVHMKHIGHPLVSDTKYLESKKCQEDRQWCPRMFLHAAVLEFADPDNPHTFVETVCPLARELVQALDNALVCVDDYEPITLRQYGIPDIGRPDDHPDDTSSRTVELGSSLQKTAGGSARRSRQRQSRKTEEVVDDVGANTEENDHRGSTIKETYDDDHTPLGSVVLRQEEQFSPPVLFISPESGHSLDEYSLSASINRSRITGNDQVTEPRQSIGSYDATEPSVENIEPSSSSINFGDTDINQRYVETLNRYCPQPPVTRRLSSSCENEYWSYDDRLEQQESPNIISLPPPGLIPLNPRCSVERDSLLEELGRDIGHNRKSYIQDDNGDGCPIPFPNLNRPTISDQRAPSHSRIRYEADPLQVHPSLRNMMSAQHFSSPFLPSGRPSFRPVGQFDCSPHHQVDRRTFDKQQSQSLRPFPLDNHIRESFPRTSFILSRDAEYSRERPRRFSGSEIPANRCRDFSSIPPGFEQPPRGFEESLHLRSHHVNTPSFGHRSLEQLRQERRISDTEVLHSEQRIEMRHSSSQMFHKRFDRHGKLMSSSPNILNGFEE